MCYFNNKLKKNKLTKILSKKKKKNNRCFEFQTLSYNVLGKLVVMVNKKIIDQITAHYLLIVIKGISFVLKTNKCKKDEKEKQIEENGNTNP